MKYNVIVIGGGPAGYVAAIRCAQLGLKVACIEKDATLGGTCLNVGCIPSKALLQSTQQYAFLAESAKEHGIEVTGAKFNLVQAMDRKARIVKGLVDGVASLFKKHNITWVKGTAKLVSGNEVAVEGTGNLTGDHIILATGSTPIPLPFLPFDEKRIVSSTGALSLPAVPKRLIVIGAGVIGVELASVYRRLGSEVVILEMLEQICPMMDQATSHALLQSLKKQGIVFHLGVKVTDSKIENDGVAVIYEEQGKAEKVMGDVVLVAVGRRPYTQGLGLKEAGVVTDAKGVVQVDKRFRTSLPTVYAIGDLIDGPMLAHKAFEEAVAVAEIIKGENPHINYMAIPNVIYTHPEVAAVGLTEKEAREAGIDVKVGTFYFRANARARCSGDTEGMVKVIGDAKSGRLLGMHIVGANASELIGEGVVALERRMTLQELANVSHAHPTLTEAIKEACLAALGKPLHV